MLSLCYVSAATSRFSDDSLTELLKKARSFNERKGITGLLLYNGVGTFVQVLEGGESEIEPLYAKISVDARHRRVNCIGRKTIVQSQFPNWSMGFKALDKATIEALDGYSSFLELDADDGLDYLKDNSQFTYSILSHFKHASFN